MLMTPMEDLGVTEAARDCAPEPRAAHHVTPLRFPHFLETRPHGTSRSAPGTQNGGLSVILGLTDWLSRIIYTVKVKPESAVKRRKSARRYRLNSPTTRVNYCVHLVLWVPRVGALLCHFAGDPPSVKDLRKSGFETL